MPANTVADVSFDCATTNEVTESSSRERATSTTSEISCLREVFIRVFLATLAAARVMPAEMES